MAALIAALSRRGDATRRWAIVSGVAWTASAVFSSIPPDPPRSDYEEIERPGPVAVPAFLNTGRGRGRSGAETRLVRAMVRSSGTAVGLVRTMERIDFLFGSGASQRAPTAIVVRQAATLMQLGIEFSRRCTSLSRACYRVASEDIRAGFDGRLEAPELWRSRRSQAIEAIVTSAVVAANAVQLEVRALGPADVLDDRTSVSLRDFRSSEAQLREALNETGAGLARLAALVRDIDELVDWGSLDSTSR